MIKDACIATENIILNFIPIGMSCADRFHNFMNTLKDKSLLK